MVEDNATKLQQLRSGCDNQNKIITVLNSEMDTMKQVVLRQQLYLV